MDTIVAISTPMGTGGIGIIRISGRDALKVADAIFIVKGKHSASALQSSPLTMCFGTFIGDGFCDKGYAVYFPSGKSFTGEDTVELYLHGGARILKGAVRAAIQNGAVTAGAGEFTKRAYLNGRMSLADAEGVADMISAESASALRAGFRLMQGGISSKINAVMDKLIDVLSTLEASLDYPDEMEDEVMPALDQRLPDILRDVRNLASTAYLGRIAKHGLQVVIAGEPNVGKSSLLNSLVGEDRAIVTDVAGTTRDTVTASVEVDGVLLNFTDTAGLRDSDDKVEAIGIDRARKAIENADVVVYVYDGTKPLYPLPDYIDCDKVIIVYNKCDKPDFSAKGDGVSISAVSGIGVDSLAHDIAKISINGEMENADLITCERHVSALNRAILALERANCAKNETIDCVLIDLREGYNALGEIVGATATEDIVNNIFSKFCVGK